MEPFKDAEHLSRAAAVKFIEIAHGAIANGGQFTVVLSGGSTPRRLFQLLAAPPYRDKVDWEKVEFFWGDERTVPPDHPDSNFHMANEALLQRLQVAPKQIHRIEAEREDQEAAARDYQTEIAHVFRVPEQGEPPSFDLILLGLGPDGHTASLFPHTEAVMESHRWIARNYVSKLNTNRITMTAPILNRGKFILFLVAGADKAEALHGVLDGPKDPHRLPAQLIQPAGGILIWMTDEAAISRLDSREPTLS
jgi:6-phosphogluconolactonase